MGKKNLQNKKEKAMLEMKHEQGEELRRLQENFVAHPLRGRDSAWLDDYVRGQLMLRKVGKTLDKRGMLLRSFAINLGISLEHLAELEMEVSQYDEQSNGELWDRLSKMSNNADDVDCFMFDIARLHGESYPFKGEFFDLWSSVCVMVFHCASDSQIAFLKRHAAQIANGEKCRSKDDFVKASKKMFQYYYLPCFGHGQYLVIDLSGGPNAVQYPCHSTDLPPNLADDTCRTTELWLRHIPGGSFMMGCPDNEIGRYYYEAQRHRVTLTRDYYVGVFQCTQRQFELVTGKNPSKFKGATLPVDGVDYNFFLRGKGIGTKWPDDSRVNKDSFFGLLQARTGLPLDLPTEAEWEYACRAGTTTALNSGKNLTTYSRGEQCPNLDALGWYCENSNGTTHPVGLKKPNAWGLYDMHGNVEGWCLDWEPGHHYDTAVEDPLGRSSRELRCYERFRVLRGGSWHTSPDMCRSASESSFMPHRPFQNFIGFRIALRS